jgi:hypothetical protein
MTEETKDQIIQNLLNQVEDLKKQNELLKLSFQVIKTSLELYTDLKNVNNFEKGGIVNDKQTEFVISDELKEQMKRISLLK